jgi:hypothetical protein
MKQPIDLPYRSGVMTEQTARGGIPFWKDSDKVRFQGGLPEKIGGWRAVNADQLFKGLARRYHDWASLDGQIWVAMGTDAKLYLWNNDHLYDITPIRRTVSLTNPFTTVSGSQVVTVTDANHTAQRGDYVRFDGATTVGGLTIDGEYQITSIVTINTYTIEAASAASSTAGPGGGTVATEYDISVGRGTTGFGTGYGTGPYGMDLYGTPRTTTAALQRARTWSLENWGEDLIANPRGGAVYWWDRSGGPNTRAIVLEGAPEQANYVIMNDRSRQLLAFGSTDAVTERFDPLLARWCSVEDFNDWAVTDENTAGDGRVYQGSEFITAVRTRTEIIAFTDKSVHSVQNIAPGEFGIELVGPNIPILGPNALTSVANRVFFMAEGDFYVYDGIPRIIECPVHDYVFDNLITFHRDKVHAGLNTKLSEVWFFYPGKTPDIWIDADFASGLQDHVFEQQAMHASATFDYTMTFSPIGYVYFSDGMTDAPYAATYLLQTGAEIVIPTECEYELIFRMANVSTGRQGLIIKATDLSGAADTEADDVTGIAITLVGTGSLILVESMTSSIVNLMTNGAANYPLSALPTPITITDDGVYGLMARVEVTDAGITTLTVYFWDEENGLTQTVATIPLTTTEAALHTGSLSGIIAQQRETDPIPSEVQYLSFRTGALDSIIEQSQRGATTEINRYVIYNYLSNDWAIGTMERTAWADSSNAFNLPYAAGLEGVFFTHEDGTDDDGAAMYAYVEGHDSELPEAGEYIMQVDQLIPDFLTLKGSVDLYLKAKKYPHNAEYQVKGPFPVGPRTTRISPRIRGRQVALRIESTDIGDHWRYGTMRARVTPHGKRGNA